MNRFGLAGGAKLEKKIMVLSITLTLLLLVGTYSSLKPSEATAQTKIEHIVFIVQENHSFDNYFGTYPGANGFGNISVLVDPLNASSGYISPFHITPEMGVETGFGDPNLAILAEAVSGTEPFHLGSQSLGQDLGHSWETAVKSYDNGKMDGFVAADHSTLAMGYYDRRDIPYYWDYADHFTLADNFFSSTFGPSLPTHLYIASGSSGHPNSGLTQVYSPSSGQEAGALPEPCIVNGSVINNPPSFGWFSAGDSPIINWNEPPLNWATLAQEMSTANKTWPWYNGDANPLAATYWNVLPLFEYFQNNPDQLAKHVKSTANFASDVASNELPAVSWIIPGSWQPPTLPEVFKDQTTMQNSVSEHPPARSDVGMDYVAYLINQVMQSPSWQSTAIVLYWDDYGGFYDHVRPPVIDAFGDGFRVPSLIISPWAKSNYIDHTEYEFGSLLRFAEENFNLPTLGARDLTANSIMNSFNFSQTPLPNLIEPANFVAEQQNYIQPAPFSSPSSTNTSPSQTPTLTSSPTIAPTTSPTANPTPLSTYTPTPSTTQVPTPTVAATTPPPISFSGPLPAQSSPNPALSPTPSPSVSSSTSTTLLASIVLFGFAALLALGFAVVFVRRKLS